MRLSETKSNLWPASFRSATIVLCLFPAIALAQGPWEIPKGSEVEPIGPPHEFPSLGGGTVVGPITFLEPELPVGTETDGLVINTLNGVPLPGPLSFGFTLGGVPSTDSTITGGPPQQMFVDPPGVEGNIDGTLSIDFGIDVASLEFGFAVACLPPAVSSAATVTAFDAGMSPVGMMSFDAVDTGNVFVENLAQFSPGIFRSVEITWADPICGRFLLDNLSYEEAVIVDPTPTIAIPTLDVAGLVVLGALLFLAALYVLRRRRARARP